MLQPEPPKPLTPTRARQAVAKDRRVRYPLLWLAFIALMVLGAAMVSSPAPGMQLLGLAMVLGPVVVLGVVTIAYYVVERRRAAR